MADNNCDMNRNSGSGGGIGYPHCYGRGNLKSPPQTAGSTNHRKQLDSDGEGDSKSPKEPLRRTNNAIKSKDAKFEMDEEDRLGVTNLYKFYQKLEPKI